MGIINPLEIDLMSEHGDEPVVFRLLTEIGIIDQLAQARLDKALPDGLKISQFIVLNHLVRLQGKWSPVRLANAFQVTKAAITNTLQRLEARDLVKIEADPADGRAKLVSLTRAGRKMREQCINNVGPFIGEITRQFGEQEINNALPFLQALRTYMDENR